MLMLKQLRGILGPVTGNLGKLQFYISKAQNLCRARKKENPLNITDLQIVHRNKMLNYAFLWKRLYNMVLYKTFRFYPDLSGYYKIFCKLNLSNALPDGNVDYSKLIVSYGDLTNRDVTTYSLLSNPTRLRIRFSTASDNINSFPNDSIHGFIYNAVRDQFQDCTYISYRSQGWLDCLIPSNWNVLDKSYYFYWYEKNDLSRLSTSKVRIFN